MNDLSYQSTPYTPLRGFLAGFLAILEGLGKFLAGWVVLTVVWFVCIFAPVAAVLVVLDWLFNS